MHTGVLSTLTVEGTLLLGARQIPKESVCVGLHDKAASKRIVGAVFGVCKPPVPIVTPV